MLEEKVFHNLLSRLDRKTKRNEAIALTEVAYTKDYKAELIFGKDGNEIPYFEIRVYGITDLGPDKSDTIAKDLQGYLAQSAHWMKIHGYTPKRIGNTINDRQKSALISEAVLQIIRSAEVLSKENIYVIINSSVLENLPSLVEREWNDVDDLAEAMTEKLSKEFGISENDPLFIYVSRIAEGWRRLLVLVTGDTNLNSKSKAIVSRKANKEIKETIDKILEKESLRMKEFLLH